MSANFDSPGTECRKLQVHRCRLRSRCDRQRQLFSAVLNVGLTGQYCKFTILTLAVTSTEISNNNSRRILATTVNKGNSLLVSEAATLDFVFNLWF